jgi:hypothetical protein
LRSSIFGFEIHWRPVLRISINVKLFLKIRHQRNGRQFVPNCQTTRRHVPEDCNLQSRSHKNLKFHTKMSCLIGHLLLPTSCYEQSETKTLYFHWHININAYFAHSKISLVYGNGYDW